MDIDIENGLKLNLNANDHTASVIGLDDKEKIIFVPRFVEYENEKYLITKIKPNAFKWKKINYLKFDENSEIDSFNEIFDSTRIQKLEFPPKLKYLGGDFAFSVYGLEEIEISPKNENFIYYENKLLLGKSTISSVSFDELCYISEDIEEVIVPPQVKVIGSWIFYNRKKLKSVIFTEDSKLEKLYSFCISNPAIERLVMPSNIEYIDNTCFSDLISVKEFELLPNNNSNLFFVDNKLLVEKKEMRILFSYRDVVDVTIPSYIKKISAGAFSQCKKLKSLTFEPNSSLEIIKSQAFFTCDSLESIVLPESVVEIDSQAFDYCNKLKSIEFLSKTIKLWNSIVRGCYKLQATYFPNAKTINFIYDISHIIYEKAKIYIRRDAKIFEKRTERIINCEEIDKNRFVYYENSDEKEESGIATENEIKKSLNEEKSEMANEKEKEALKEEKNEKINEEDEMLSSEFKTINNDSTNVNNPDKDGLQNNNDAINENSTGQQGEVDKDIIHQYILANDAKSLINFIHSKYNFDQISSIFNDCYKIPNFYAMLCEEGIKINDAVSHHKSAISLIFNSNKKDRKNKLIKARKHLEESIRLGYNLSYFSLARLLHEYFKEDDLAFKTASEGMIKGEKYSKCLLGHFISKGIGTKKNHQEGVKLMIESKADDYYERFATDIGIYYFNIGENIKQTVNNFEYENLNEFKTSFKWFEKAFQMNKTHTTINNYGVCFLRGIGVSIDFEKAKEIFEIGVNENDAISMYHLAFILSKTNPNESLYYYKKSAELGYYHARKIIPFLDEN